MPVMASVARTTHACRCWSSAVAGVWKGVGGSLSSSVLHYRIYSDEGLDGRVPPSPSAADPPSGQFSSAALTTQTFGAERPVYDKNAYPLSKREGFRVYRPMIRPSRTTLSEEERPVYNCILAGTNVAQESCHDSPRKGFASGKCLPIGSGCGRGNLHMACATTTSEAIAILKHRQQQGLSIDSYMFVEILKRCSMQKDLIATRQVHDYIIQSGMQKNQYVATTLLNVYIKCGRLQDAHGVFVGLERTNRTVITWNVMIGAYAKCGRGMEAYRLFLQMKQEGFEPNAITYVSILNASASAGALEWVKEVHGHARKARLESELRVGTALVHMYAKIGSIDDARLVFDRMDERDVVTWAAMIGGLGLHGCGGEALNLFEEMIADYVKPNATLFVAVLSACCHAGLVDDGRRLFSAMKQDYGIEPTVVHYTCMVDMLGRAGHLEEAKLLIDKMPVKPNAVTWTALLGACRTHSNVELGELAAAEVLKLEPKYAAAYVLLSNIYAAAGKWEKMSSVRTLMQERGVRKEPGRSWIEVDNKIHEFVVGDKSHPAAKAIYRELTQLSEQLKAKGYIPDTKLVLRNIDEEEKELALCSHSEKLAIAYGLLRVPRGKSIRVEKNLRVCLDCHTATKLISEVTGREIIVRDATRFHNFKDGVCSCGDYW